MKFQVQVRLVLADLWGMKTLGTLFDQKVLNLRSVVETCFSVVKTRLNLVSTLARSEFGYITHYILIISEFCLCMYLKTV